MRGSHRSDRELAKVLDFSQPTVTRTRRRLEKEGLIKEYTMIPDFGRLGFQIMSFTLVKLRRDDTETMEKIRKQLRETLKETPFATLLALNGLGANADRMVVAFHKSYSEYLDFVKMMKQHPLVNIEKTNSFLVNLGDENHYQTLTFSELASYVAKMNGNVS